VLDQDGLRVLCNHRGRDGVICPEPVAERFYIVAQARERWPLTMRSRSFWRRGRRGGAVGYHKLNTPDVN
jgi:hypothetical protein